MNHVDNAVHWSQRGACRDADPDLFIATEAAHGKKLYAKALAYCRRCPVTQQCLDRCFEVHSASSDMGVWGNTTPEQRAQMWKRRQR